MSASFDSAPDGASTRSSPLTLARWLGGAASPSTLAEEGAQRCQPVELTLARAQRVAARAGVTRVANVTGLDTVGLPVVSVCRPNARSLVVSQGKGLSLAAATASGLMEAIEAFHAEHVELPLRYVSQRELQLRARVVDVTGLPRAYWRTLAAERATLWARGIELFRDVPTWVPFELVHTNFSLPLPAGSGTFLMSSNGLASGNHVLEAISHGLCELVERDCMALFAANGGVSQAGRRIDLSSVDDPAGRQVIAQLQAADLSVGLWDVTSDVGLAAFACVIVDRSANVFRQLYYATGSGCHPLRRVALTRALTEAAQCRLTYIAGARDDADRDFFERARDPERVARMRRIVDDPTGPSRPFSSVPDREHRLLEDDVTWELACLERAGLREVVVVDLSKPDFDIPVVRVIVPGLESLQGAPGYTPGRRAQALPLQLPRMGTSDARRPS